jgi:hypothetical protein
VSQLNQSTVVTSLLPDEIGPVLEELGLTYEIDKDGRGDPVFQFAAAGFNMALFLYGKDEASGRYSSLQMYVGFREPSPLAKINDWNAEWRFGRAYQSKESGARLESDLDLAGGVTVGAVKAFVHRFESLTKAFARHLSGD